MKRNNIFYLIACVAMLLTGCSKSFLDRAPESVISDAQFWKTANDLRLYSNSFYNLFPSYGGFGTIGIYGNDADDGSDNMIYINYNARMNGEITPAGAGGWASGDWSPLRNINYLLANYGKVTDPWDNIKGYVGEALFFRAWFYFDKLRKFGDLPWISKPLDLTSPELYTKRISRGIIVDSVLADLDKAATYLPTKSAAGANRINKEVALALASRIALYEGTWEKYHAGDPFGVAGSDGQKYLQKCVTLSDAIMNTAGFGLDNTGTPNGYWSLFNLTTYKTSKEVMLSREYSVALGITHNWHRYTNSGAGRGLTKGLVDDYLCKDGLPISVSLFYKGDATLLDVVKDRDPRLAQTIYVNDGAHVITQNQPGSPTTYFQYPVFTGANEGKCATGYQLYKGHDPEFGQQSAGNVGTSALILFRFAEVLLNYAEAKAELGQLTQADADKTINLLRQRVGMPNLILAAIVPDTKWVFPTLSPIINEVRRERRVELSCEGFRHDDVFRWAAAGSLITGWKPKGAIRQQWVGIVDAAALNAYPVDANGYIETYKNSASVSTGYKFNPQRDYLWPIPLEQLQVPNNTLTQNPGWGN